MQTKRDQLGYEMMLLPSLESYIPEDYHLRRLNRILDLSFIHEAVRERYCQDNGRPSIDPEVIIRLFLLQAIEGISHVRELIRQVQLHLGYRWFIGYRLDESLPDHSTLSRALDRLGDDVFNTLFERSISQCQQSGLIEGRVLHVDATTIRADIDANRVNKPNSSDPDARFGRFPNGKKLPGYKQETVADDRFRVIVGVSVFPANHSDGREMIQLVDAVSDRLGDSPEVVCADGAYSSGKNCEAMETREIRLVSPPQKPSQKKGAALFTVEDFVYDESRDVFICPAGQELKFAGLDKSGGRTRRQYCAWRSHCRCCELKNQCTRGERRALKVTSHHEALRRLRADSQTESFRQLYRCRAPVIEGVFAEAKQWHGLRRAWRRGLSKMRVQCLLIAAVINLKRLAAVFCRIFGLKRWLHVVIDAIMSVVRYFRQPRVIRMSEFTL
jgi:transposase